MGDLAPSYRQVIFANVSTVLSAAVDDDLLLKNPCKAGSVTKPRAPQRKVVPWPAEVVAAVHDALPERYQILVTLCAGLGLRQGEAFGLSPDDVDFLRGTVEIRRQVKLYGDGTQTFGLPKGQKARTVPLGAVVRDELAGYLAKWPPKLVTLDSDDGATPTTVPIVVTTREATVITRGYSTPGSGSRRCGLRDARLVAPTACTLSGIGMRACCSTVANRFAPSPSTSATPTPRSPCAPTPT